MNQITIQTGSRDRIWPFGRQSSTLRNLETAFRASLGLRGKLQDARAALAGSGRLTPSGVAEEARRLAREQFLPDIVRGASTLQRARKSAQDRLAALKPAAPLDKQDLVGAFRRAEIRDAIRALPKGQRDEYLRRYSHELDSETPAALLEHVEFPWTQEEARLLSAETRSTLLRRILPADELAKIDELEAAISYVSDTIAEGKAVMQAELNINEPDFAGLVRAETSKTTIWLNRAGDAIRVMLVDQRTPHTIPTRAATADEIESGIFFKDLDEYQAAVAAAA